MKTSHPLGSLNSGLFLRSLGALVALLLLLTLIGPLAAAAPDTATRYVATTGADAGNDCLDPGLPCRTIQHAIDVAGNGDEVLIAQGTYQENLVIPITLALRGGFEADGRTRDLDLFPTIIDGSGNPIEPGGWESNTVAKATVVRDDTIFRMWYDGSNLVDDVQVGLASSGNGKTWARSAANPVLTGTPGSWDEFASERAPFVLKEGGVFKMWYESGEPRQLGYATSPNGVTWTKHPDNPILSPGPDGYDRDAVGHGAVLHEGIYKLWYHAIGDEGPIIAYATSPDGVNWIKHGPVLLPDSGAWDDRALWGPSVIRYQGLLHMWYAADGSNTQPSIGLAVSSDGMSWTRISLGGPVFGETTPIGDPHVLLHGSIFKMWYTDYAAGTIKYAESLDGVNWTPWAGNPVLEPAGDPGAWGEPVVRFEGDSNDSLLDGLRITGGQGREGGGVHAASASISIIHCRIYDNYAGVGDSTEGGGVLGAMDGKTLIIEDSLLVNNSSRSGASAVRAHGGSLNMVNVLIAHNHSPEAPAVHLNGAATLTNVTIADNDSGVLHNPVEPLPLIVRNSIIYNNGWAIAVEPGSVVEVGFSNIEAGWPGPGNIDEPPMFRDSDTLDYHLRWGSPCIDTGANMWAPDHDVEGDPRPLDGNGDGTAVADMGADELLLQYNWMPMLLHR